MKGTSHRGRSWGLAWKLGPERKQMQSDEPRSTADDVRSTAGDSRVGTGNIKRIHGASDNAPEQQQQQQQTCKRDPSFMHPVGSECATATARVRANLIHHTTPQGSMSSYGVQTLRRTPTAQNCTTTDEQAQSRPQDSQRSSITQHHDVWLDVTYNGALASQTMKSMKSRRGLPPHKQLQQVEKLAVTDTKAAPSARGLRALTEWEVRRELERLARVQKARINWKQPEDEGCLLASISERRQTQSRLYTHSARRAPGVSKPRVYS